MPLSSSPLVTLVACDSTTQTIATGDEPLGILTGLLCAGAASVVGASWPIISGTGRIFSNAIYSELDKEKSFAASNHNDNRLADIAFALQKAILYIRNYKDTSETYHWGAFSLWGSWLYQQWIKFNTSILRQIKINFDAHYKNSKVEDIFLLYSFGSY